MTADGCHHAAKVAMWLFLQATLASSVSSTKQAQPTYPDPLHACPSPNTGSLDQPSHGKQLFVTAQHFVIING